MSEFVSYAQNFEDVMLWRALKHISNGTYIDVGAQDPVIDSVSKAFYDRGWRGIHIEPVHDYANLLRKNRPDETVLEVAIGDTNSTIELNVIPNTGLSTSIESYAKNASLIFGHCHKVQVPMLTLAQALTFMKGKDVHWLKIDVEGFEEPVLKGWDSQTLRPWIIVIEATIPNSPELAYAAWAPLMIKAGYLFVYFDGLNRFYIAQEHPELMKAFSCPPNFFDHFTLSSTSPFCPNLIETDQLHEETLESGMKATHSQNILFSNKENAQLRILNANLQKKLDAAIHERDEFDHCSHHWWSIAEKNHQELHAIHVSHSWRITAPLRQAKLFLYSYRRPAIFQLAYIKSVVRKSPRLLIFSRRVLTFFHKMGFSSTTQVITINNPVNIKHFDDLLSVKTMGAVAKAYSDIDNTNSIIFL